MIRKAEERGHGQGLGEQVGDARGLEELVAMAAGCGQGKQDHGSQRKIQPQAKLSAAMLCRARHQPSGHTVSMTGKCLHLCPALCEVLRLHFFKNKAFWSSKSSQFRNGYKQLTKASQINVFNMVLCSLEGLFTDTDIVQ